MNTELLAHITRWMGGTDLIEIVYGKNGESFELRSLGAPAVAAMPSCPLEPVAAPAVGIYRFAQAGKSKPVAEGLSVKEGDRLGYIETFSGAKPVAAPCGGFVKLVCVEDGKPVNYGQPLFFVERR